MQKPSKPFTLPKEFLVKWTAATDVGGVGNVVYDPERLRAKYNTDFAPFGLLGGGDKPR